jgi:hypothetical protein
VRRRSLICYHCQAGDDETAFSGGRSPRHGVFIVGLAPDAGLLDAERSWVRGLWEALRPHAMGSGDGYINGITDFSDDRVRHSYGPAKYERLPRSRRSTTQATCSTSTPTSGPPDAASASVRVRKPIRFRRTRGVSSKHEIRLRSAWVGRLEFA